MNVSRCFFLILVVAVFLSFASGCGTAYEPFNGENLTGWNYKYKDGGPQPKWVVGKAEVSPENPSLLVLKQGTGEMINLAQKFGDSIDIYTVEKFGDCRIEVELMIPKGSNSGVYVMGEYEVQVYDSYGREKMEGHDMGAIYGAAPPPVNASKAPGQWQKYVIDFRAPRFDSDGNKVKNAAFMKIVLNGQVIHEGLEMPGPTPAGVTGKEAPTGPIMFQGDHGPVAYRNIRITDL